MVCTRQWATLLLLPGVIFASIAWSQVSDGGAHSSVSRMPAAAGPQHAHQASPSAGSTAAATTTTTAATAEKSGDLGASLLGILDVRPSISRLQLENVGAALLGGDASDTTPLHLSSDAAYVPHGFLVHRDYAKLTCPLTPYELLNHIQHEMSVLQCSEKCAASPDCLYFTSFFSGSCALFSACSSGVASPEKGTTYARRAVGGSSTTPVYSNAAHATAHCPMCRGVAAAGAAASGKPEHVTHLWRLNKTFSSYYFEGPDVEAEMPECIHRHFQEEFDKRVHTDTQVPELGVDQVYMVHYTKLVTRRAVITRQHAVQDMASDWVTSFDHQNISAAMRKCIHETWEPQRYTNAMKKSRKVPSPFVSPGGFKGGELSVNTKHHFIYYNIVRRKQAFTIVLEDDAKLRAGFRQWFVEAMRSVPPDFDVVMFGGCLKMYGWRAKSRATRLTPHLYRKGEARCAHAYALTLGAAKKLLSSMPLTDVIDYQINRAILETNLRVYWIEPWLAVQGPVGEAGQPRKQMTSGGDGEPFNPDKAHDPQWVETWAKPVPPQPLKSFKIPRHSSSPICLKVEKECFWL